MTRGTLLLGLLWIFMPQGVLAQSDGVPAIIRADVITRLSAQVTGVVLERPTPRGRVVQKDDVLLRIDPTRYRIVLDRAEAEVTKAKAQLTLAEAELRRTRELSEKSSVQRAELDRAESEALVAQASLRAAEVAHAEARWHLERTDVRAPHDGTVTEVLPELGEMVQSGSQVVEIQTTSRLVAESFLEPRDRERFQVGALVKITTAVPTVLEMRGRVTEVAAIANAQRCFRVRVALEDPPESLRGGFEARIEPAPHR